MTRYCNCISIIGINGKCELYNFNVLLKLLIYLNNCKVNDKWHCTAKYCVGTVFGTVAHTIMPTITSNYNVIMPLQFSISPSWSFFQCINIPGINFSCRYTEAYSLFLLTLQKPIEFKLSYFIISFTVIEPNQWIICIVQYYIYKQHTHTLMIEEGWEWDTFQPHVPEHPQDFCRRSTSNKYAKGEEEVTSWDLCACHVWLTKPFYCFATLWVGTAGGYICHCTILLYFN